MTDAEHIETEAELVYTTFHAVAKLPCGPWSAISEREKRAWREASQAGIRARIERVSAAVGETLQPMNKVSSDYPELDGSALGHLRSE